ncbi:MAG: hypothetical protein NC124_07495 [Clostridium sp.]|nr:hypothetical protein [Clostridium sp.]
MNMKDYLARLNWKICLFMLLGNFFIGLSICMLRLAGFGTDPFSCMNIGVSNHLPVSYGTYQLMFNLILFIPMICCFRKGLGLGTLVNMAGVGYIADFCVWLFSLAGVTAQGMEKVILIRILFMCVGVLATCFGVALYMECDLGTAPYDALAQIIEQLTHGKMKFKWARILTDVISVLVGFISGSIVGIATIVTAFFTGPIVTWFREKVIRKRLAVYKQ